MHPSLPSPSIARAAGVAALLALLAACGDRAPALAAQAQLAEPLEAAWRQLTEPPMAAVDGSCDTAPTLAVALDGWRQAVDAAGLQSRFAAETAEAQRRAADIRSRCADAIATLEEATRRSARERPRERTRKADKVARPAITPASLEAYTRGLDEEIRLMRASGRHFVSLSKYDEEGRQVAARAGLSVAGYADLKRAVHDVLYARMLHQRYAGAAGQARLAGLEPHKREHAVEVLARDPFAALSPAERNAMQAPLDGLQAHYGRYLELAVVGD